MWPSAKWTMISLTDKVAVKDRERYNHEKDAHGELAVTAPSLNALSLTRRILFYWLPVVVYCLMIFIQSSLPAAQPLAKLSYGDKLVHFAAYAVLGALFLRAFRTGNLSPSTALWASVAATALYGLSDELHQALVPFRHADGLDWLADALGGLLGAYAYHRIVARWHVLFRFG